jgi:hypothetical protein
MAKVAMKGRIRELLIPLKAANAGEIVFPANQNLHGREGDDSNLAYVRPFPEAAVDLTLSPSAGPTFWSTFRFVKETGVWIAWIPLLLVVFGVGMNFLAVRMNHGIMPVVLPSWGRIGENDKMHVVASANSRCLFLCDWIHLHSGGDVASPGDWLIRAGNFLQWPLVWMWIGISWGRSTWRKLIGSYANA